jgi:hypothetical protein
MFVTQTMAQSDDAGKLLQNGLADGKYLLTGYLAPVVKPLSLGLNQGWYNTAKPHKTFGVDLTVTVSPMFFPSSDSYYTVDNSKLTEVELLTKAGGTAQTQPTKVPTMLGPTDPAPVYQKKGNTDPANQFEGPGGLNIKKTVGNYIPVPMATLGIGLPKSIELRFRFCPTLTQDNFKFNLFGIGVMHDIKQYLPGIKLLPFDLSAFVGYTHMQVDANFGKSNSKVIEQDERGVFQVNSTTIQGVISKKVSVLTVYGSVGYNIAKTKIAMKGTYDFNDNNKADAGEVNPLTLAFAASGPRISGGFRLKLAVFTLHADYTLQKYSSVSAGFGINVR